MIYWMTVISLGVACYCLGWNMRGDYDRMNNPLEVVAQNEGTCRSCGAQTIITIRERKGDNK